MDARRSLGRAGGVALTGTLLVVVVAGFASLSQDRSEPVRVVGAVVSNPPAGLGPPLAAGASEGGRRHAADTVSLTWVTKTATAAGIPEVAMRAYGEAALAVGRTEPACHLGWTTLAGVGWVESQHGTIGGRTLGADGRPDRPVFGPALDGDHRRAAIRAQAGGWERAVGPLQFLPSTWESWGSDGDGDGVADPQDLDDAAWAAARYLCASGQDLSTGPGWSAVVESYNHSEAYVRAVYDAATTYAARVAP